MSTVPSRGCPHKCSQYKRSHDCEHLLAKRRRQERDDDLLRTLSGVLRVVGEVLTVQEQLQAQGWIPPEKAGPMRAVVHEALSLNVIELASKLSQIERTPLPEFASLEARSRAFVRLSESLRIYCERESDCP